MFKRTNILCWVIAACGTVIFLVTSVASSQTWTSLDGPYQPRDVRDIASSSDGTVLYAVDKTFLFKSTNGGSSWAKTGVPLASPLVVICKPDNSNIVVAGVSGYLYRNEYGGSSGNWDQVLFSSGMTPLRLAVSVLSGQTNQMWLGRKAVSGQSSIYYSDNAGATWVPRFPSAFQTDISDIAPYPSSSAESLHVWACGVDPSGAASEANPNATASVRGVWFSSNLGVTWQSRGMGDFNVKAIAIHPNTSPRRVYAGTASGKLYQSINYDSNWTAVTAYNALNASAVYSIKVRTDSNYIFVASNLGVHVSTNFGSNWSLVKSTDPLTMIVPSNAQRTIYVGTPDTVLKSTNSGSTWSVINNRLGLMPLSSATGTADNVYTTSNDFNNSGYYNGSSWTLGGIGTNGTFRAVDVFRNLNGDLYAAGAEATNKATLYKSTDGMG
jgi:hypothetical protein